MDKDYEMLGAVGGMFLSIKKKNGGRPMKEIWFETGEVMKGVSGDVKCTVAAYSEGQYKEYISKGWKPVNPDEPVPEAPATVDGITKRTKKDK